MVYDRATTPAGIGEDHPTKPASPYAASKLAGEALTLSYFHAYGLPTTVVRPFNTYGPFQRSVGEGGVVAIFTRRSLLGEELRIYGDGTQTRDLLYVEDCARFVVRRAALRRGRRADPQRRDRARRVGQRAGGADRAGPGADRPRRAHPPPERDRRPALRRAPGAGGPGLGARRSSLEEGLARTRDVDGGAARARDRRWPDGDRGRRRRARDRRRDAGPRRRSCRTPTSRSPTTTSRRSWRRCAPTG